MSEHIGPPSLNDLGFSRRWVTWIDENDSKIPKDPATGRNASSNDRETWGKRAQAEWRWRRMQNGKDKGGIGFVLGSVFPRLQIVGTGIELDGVHILGLDLDGCLQQGVIADLANGVIERFKTYTEISPSGNGVKLFFQVLAKDAQAARDLIGGKLRKAFSKGPHQEIAIDFGRYYTVTGNQLGTIDRLRLVSFDDLKWLITDVGPRYAGGRGKAASGDEGDDDGKGGRDDSRSGDARRFFQERRDDYGEGYEAARAAILDDLGRSGEWAREWLRKGEKGERQFRNAWERTHAPHRRLPIHSWNDPDMSLLEDRRGDLPDFPLTDLSKDLQGWVKDAANGKACTVDHVAVPLLGVASSLIGVSRRAQASPSWVQPMTCWTAIVGASGTGKTPGLDASRDALAEIEKQYQLRIGALRLEHNTRADKADALLKQWKKDLKEATEEGKDPPPRPPDGPGEFVNPRLFFSNATTERIADLLMARPQGALQVSDELAGLFLNMKRYHSGSDKEFWLEAWNGGPYPVERKGRPPTPVKYLLVGVVGGFQPDKMVDSFKGSEDGMYARLLFSWPDEAPYQPLALKKVEPLIVKVFGRLAHLGGDDPEDFSPRDIALTVDAVDELEVFRKRVADDKEKLEGREREWWVKAPAHVLRLAGTLAYLDWATSDRNELRSIGTPFVTAAVDLVSEYFWPHARAALRQIGLSQSHSQTRRVLRWIRREKKERVSRDDIRSDALARSLDANQTQELLEGIERAGWLRRMEVPRTGPGPRPKRWDVNPILLSLE